jgi:hypothetical protein
MRVVGVLVLAACLAGCARAPDPNAMVTHPAAADFSASDAVIFVEGERKAENIVFHRSFTQALRFQNMTLLEHPRLRADGSIVPDVLTISPDRAPFAVAAPGEYVLTAIEDANSTPAQTYRFDLGASPVRFTVAAGEIADLGRIVFHNDPPGRCAAVGRACDASLGVRVEPHNAAEQAAMLARLGADYPQAGQGVVVRPAEVVRAEVGVVAESGAAFRYVTP